MIKKELNNDLDAKPKVKRGRKSKDEFNDLTAKVYEIVIENG